jgi:hypothetical protein
MIFIKEKVRGTLYNVESMKNYVKARMQTAEKKQDGTWENSSWFVNFVGKAKDKVAGLGDKSKIEITSMKITNVYNKEKKQSYLNVVVFDCDVTGAVASDTGSVEGFIPIEADDDLPF